MTLPTYEMGAPDPNPVFAERRAYQGAEAPVYPYPMWDAVGDRRVQRSYRVIVLENRHVEIRVLPEIGGRLFSARAKANGYDFVYRQSVIRPALIGMVGAWISGGIEWNIPHHHRASTFLPVDASVSRDPDGSAAVRVGELELRHRMRWVVELRLRPDSSCIEQTIRLINRTPVAHSFLCFANIAVHANRDYQVIFPPDTRWVTHHGKREFARWPVADTIYNDIDFRKGVDVSWWKNHPSPISMFAWGSKMDFVAGYDHGRRAGLVHVADRHISPGKKFFTWGCGEAGRMWDRVLTESDGPYIELMAGAYSDNQPDYSWIGPYQTKSAEAFWYPIAGIGGVRNATRLGALNVEFPDERTARVAVAVTSPQPDLTVTLASPGTTPHQVHGDAAPDRPLLATCPLPAAARPLTVRVLGGSRELVSATVEDDPVPGPMPEPVRPPARPEEIRGTEELYCAGLRLEQFHSAALDPEDYYRETLRRDPNHTRANTALGIRAWQRGLYAEAERRLLAALAPAAPWYMAPREGAPHYYLGLARRALGKDAAAADAFERAAWVPGWESPACQQLAELHCARGAIDAALACVDRALAADARNVKSLVLKAALFRRRGRAREARELATRALAIDPLDPWALRERSGKTDGMPADGNRCADPQACLETAIDYAGAGLWDDALATLSSADGKAASQPIVKYWRAYCLERLGRETDAAAEFGAAAAEPADGVFPFRLETIAVLRRARERRPDDHRAAYYLGNILMLHRRPEEAIGHWEESRRLNPGFALVHRNLALAYAKQPGNLARAVVAMESAVARGGGDARHCLELDQLREAAGVPVAQRLEFLEEKRDVVMHRDDTLARWIALLVETGGFERALELLRGRQFHVWEGAGRTAVHNSFVEAHLGIGHRHADAGRTRDALASYTAALQYPANLGTGRPLRGERLTETHYHIARTHAALGDKNTAARHFALALQSAPADLAPKRPAAIAEPEMYCYAARALECLGRAPEAPPIYSGLIRAGKEHLRDHVPMYFFASFGVPQPERQRFAQAHFVIGLGLQGLGRRDDARAEFDEALRLDPNHAGAKRQGLPKR